MDSPGNNAGSSLSKQDDRQNQVPFSGIDRLSRLEMLSHTRNSRNSRVSNQRAITSQPAKCDQSVLMSGAEMSYAQRTINKMDSIGARKIHSAQVILDPAGVIKELVENALDAGATRIDIRLRGKAGLDSVAVSDNGKGISERDYSSVCCPGSTSKIRQFHDLDSLSSFGFRGEALSAICAIAKGVSILTRTAYDTRASSLTYNSGGSLVERRPAARPVGTTVFVESLFHSLPVRRKDALKNSTREIAKCVATTQAIALISVNARIELKVANETKVVSRVNVIDQPRQSALSDSGFCLDLSALGPVACNILGRRAVSALLEISCDNLAAWIADDGIERSPRDKRIVIPRYGCQGLVSNASLGAEGSGGRARSSHQYVYANGRTVDFPRLTRTVNELYRRVTGFSGASPMLILNLTLPIASYDFNIAPDKRELFIRDEPILISGLLAYLESIWAPKKVNRIPVQPPAVGLFRKRLKTTAEHKRHGSNLAAEGRGVATQSESQDTAERMEVTASPQFLSIGQKVSQDFPEGSLSFPAGEASAAVDTEQPMETIMSGSEAATEQVNAADSPRVRIEKGPSTASVKQSGERVISDSEAATEKVNAVESLFKSVSTNAVDGSKKDDRDQLTYSPESRDNRQGPLIDLPSSGSPKSFKPKPVVDRLSILKSLCPAKRNITQFVSKKARSIPSQARVTSSSGESDSKRIDGVSRSSRGSRSSSDRVLTRIDECSSATTDFRLKKRTIIKMDWTEVCKSQLPSEHVKRIQQCNEAKTLLGTKNCFEKSSMTEEGAFDSSRETMRAAEMEMSRLFQQEWFYHLQILGQFNRGFIICSLGADLFIIDQHASDEKFNFEELQRTTVISKQQLVRPLALELSAEDELIVLQHLDAFRAGGFSIEYRETNKPTQRLYLRSQPISKRTMFVQDDLRDMIDMLKMSLQHSSSLKLSVLRPPRIRAMFASRACRKSVMIGTALQKSQMERIVRHLGSIEHPWTCPHGRPTMRHLCCLLST